SGFGKLTGGATPPVNGYSRICATLRDNAGNALGYGVIVCAVGSVKTAAGATPDLTAAGSGTIVYHATFSASDTVKLYAYRDAPYDAGNGQAWGNASIYRDSNLTPSAPSITQLGYTRIS